MTAKALQLPPSLHDDVETEAAVDLIAFIVAKQVVLTGALEQIVTETTSLEQ